MIPSRGWQEGSAIIVRGLCAWIVTLLILMVALAASVATAQGASAPTGMDVVLVLDQSGSMKQNDPQRLMVQAARAFVEKLGPEDAAGLVVFGSQARAAHSLASLADREQREGLLTEIARIRYSDRHTNISAGIERGVYELKQHGRPDAMPFLIFITDGIMDTGSGAKDVEMRVWLRTQLLPEARQRGIRLFSVALTEQADYALIQEMASVTGGDYYRALSAQEIARLFDGIHTNIMQRRAPTSPTPEIQSMPSPATVSGPILAWTWPWIAGTVGLAILMLGGVIITCRHWLAVVRGRQTPSAPRIPLTAPVPTEARAATAHLRDLRTGKTIALSNCLTRIGRNPDNDIVIAERQVSGHHGEIECRGSHFYLRDLRSTNGTWINEERLQIETMLKTGDVIRFDVFSYAFHGPDSMGAGTMLGDFRKGTLMGETPRLQSTGSALAETAWEYAEAARDSFVGLQWCPTHVNLEKMYQCERCGSLWCALCSPSVPGERLCKRCREVGTGHCNPVA